MIKYNYTIRATYAILQFTDIKYSQFCSSATERTRGHTQQAVDRDRRKSNSTNRI